MARKKPVPDAKESCFQAGAAIENALAHIHCTFYPTRRGDSGQIYSQLEAAKLSLERIQQVPRASRFLRKATEIQKALPENGTIPRGKRQPLAEKLSRMLIGLHEFSYEYQHRFCKTLPRPRKKTKKK